MQYDAGIFKRLLLGEKTQLPSSSPPVSEKFKSIKVHVIPANLGRKLPMATAKAACVHPSAVFWKLTRIWENRIVFFIAPFILVTAQSTLQGCKWDTASTQSMKEGWEGIRCLSGHTKHSNEQSLISLKKSNNGQKYWCYIFSASFFSLSLTRIKDATKILRIFLIHCLNCVDFFSLRPCILSIQQDLGASFEEQNTFSALALQCEMP